MSMDLVTDVAEFFLKFDMYYRGPPRELPPKMKFLRKKRIQAEYVEYNNAFFKKDHVEQLDALVDIVYIAIGTALLHGWDFQEAWNRVHEANMTKERKGYDIVKPPGFTHPDLTDLVLPMQLDFDTEL
jgi:hypothetical protein